MSLPSNAEDAGPIPGQRTKIPHATRQLSLCGNCRAHALGSACASTKAEPTRGSGNPARRDSHAANTAQTERSQNPHKTNVQQ